MSFDDILRKRIDEARNNAYDYVESTGSPRPGPARPPSPDLLTIDKVLAEGGMPPEAVAQMTEAYEKQFGHLGVGIPQTVQQNAMARLGMDQNRALATSPQPAPTPTEKLLSVAKSKSVSGNSPINLGEIVKGTSGGNLSELMSKLNPELQTAQSNRNQMQLISLLGKASNQVLGGQTHTKPSNEVWDDIGKQAGQGITDIKTRNDLAGQELEIQEKMAKNDPNSSISNTYRASVKKMLGGANLPDNISAAQLEKVFPVFEKLFFAEQNALARKEAATERASWRQTQLDETKRDRFARAKERFSQYAEKDPILVQMKKENIALDQVERLIALTEAGNDMAGGSALGAKMARAMGEVGVLTDRDIVNYVTNGQLDKKAADVLSRWTMGKPSQATLNDLKQISKVIKDSYAQKVQPIYNKYATRLSDFYEIPMDVAYRAMDAGEGYSTKGSNVSQNGSQDNEAVAWAKANPNDPRAKEILQLNGVK